MSETSRDSSPLSHRNPSDASQPTSAALGRSESRGVTPVAIVNTILRHRSLLLLAALVAGLLQLGIILSERRTYTSTASFQPMGRRNQATNLSTLAAQFGVAIPNSTDDGRSPAFYVDLIQSREILVPVAKTTFSVPTEHGLATKSLAAFYGGSEKDSSLALDRALRTLRRSVIANFVQRTGIVTLAVRAQTPQLSQQILEQVIRAVNDFNLRSRQSQALVEREFVNQRTEEARLELQAAEQQLSDFLERNRTFVAPELRFQQGRLERVVAFRQQIFTTLAQSLEQAKLEEVRTTPVIAVIEQPDVPVFSDSRHAALRLLVALAVGALLAFFIALAREGFGDEQNRGEDDSLEFRRLCRETLTDLRHPIRWVGRIARRAVSRRSIGPGFRNP